MRQEGRFYICCRRGCPRRSVDAATICNYFKLNSWSHTKDARKADLIIVYSCGAFQRSEKRSLRTIKLVTTERKENAKIVVTGCLTKINPMALNHNSGVHIIEPQDLFTLDDIIEAKIDYETVPDANIITDVEDLASEDWFSLGEKFLRTFRLSATIFRFAKTKLASWKKVPGELPEDVYNLKIAHGCLGKCTYCAIRLATGKLKSKPMEKILLEFENGLAKGFKRFALIAEDVGCYGLDIGANIVKLLKKIFDRKDDFSIIINDFNINWMIKYYKYLLPLIIEHRNRIEDIRMPIQSGSDRILKLMRRPYRVNSVKRVISDLTTKVPDLKILTHMLVGFPGETQSDFEQSRQMLQELDLTSVSVYKYEDRPGTQAYLMPSKIPPGIKFRRAFELTSLMLKKKSL